MPGWVGTAAGGLAMVMATCADAAPTQQPAPQDVPLVLFGGGGFGLRHDVPEAEAELQLRGPPVVWRLEPQGGVLTASGGEVYGWLGIAIDLPVGDHLAVTPAVGVGLYHGGGGFSLGYPVEFRSQIEIAWRFDDGARLGVQGYHISNAGLGRHNPGAEGVALVVALPLGS